MTTIETNSVPQQAPRWLARAVLAAAVVEVVAPLVTINGPGSSPASGSGPDLLITPVGWAFAIWGVIYTLAVAQAVAVLVRGAHTVPRRLQADLLVLYLGGAVWILLAAFDSSAATAAALLVMLVAGVDAVLTVSRASVEPRWLSVLTRTMVGLYAGWVTAAFFLNLSTALVDLGAVEADALGWQLAVLAVAAVTLLVLEVRTGGVVAFAVSGSWALLGITVTGIDDGTAEVTAVASIAAVCLVAVTVVVVATGHRRAPSV